MIIKRSVVMKKMKIYHILIWVILLILVIVLSNSITNNIYCGKENKFDNNLLSIMIETGEASGQYEKSNNSLWPTGDYVFNAELSMVVLAFYAVSRISVGGTFIACMLTIVGYSINATIVIFDRIREELPLMKRNTDLSELVNKCITQTLTRSIYTSLTTFIMVAVLFIMGVSSIREFAAPLMVGIVCGGYSSVCVTGALWYVMKTKVGKKAQPKKKKK